MKTSIVFYLVVFITGTHYSQNTLSDSIQILITNLEKIKENNEEDEKEKIFEIGLSLGFNKLTKNSRKSNMSFSISPIDSNLYLSPVNDGNLIISTSFNFNPRIKTENINKSLNEQINSIIYSEHKEDQFKNLDILELNLFNKINGSTFGLDTNKLNSQIKYKNTISRKNICQSFRNKNLCKIYESEVKDYA